jgi:aryl-alcohol dehydrogenase-like predicted oxidoreductase
VALDHVSAELDVSPATAQLAWLLAKRGVVAPLVHVTRPVQLDLLMDAAAVRLTRAQMLELDRAVETVR